MPLIPLFNDGQTVKQPVTQAPQGQRIRVVMNANQATAGFASPLLPYSLADRSGMGAIGQAMQQAAGLMETVSLKKAEAINIRRVAEADRAMQTEIANFENWKLQNPDETTWEAEWQGRLGSMPDALFVDGLSPVAQEEIQSRFTQFQGQSAIRLSTDVAKTAFRKAGEELEAQALNAFESGDVTAGVQAIQMGVEKGYISGDRGARLAIAGRNQAKVLALDDLNNGVSAALDDPDRTKGIERARELIEGADSILRPPEKEAKLARITATHAVNLEKDQLQQAILTDPKAAISSLNDPEKFKLITGGDRAAALASAKQSQAAYATDAFQDLKTRIDLGQVKPDEAFTGPGMEQLTPLMVDVLKARNMDRTRVASMNNPEAFQKAQTAIAGFAPAEGDSLARANFEAYLEHAFSGPHLDVLKKQWTEKTEGKLDAVSTGEAFSALDRWAFEEQRMGSFKTPKTDKDGNIIQKKSKSYVVTPGMIWGQNEKEVEVYTPDFEENPVKRDKVAQEVGRVKDLIRSEIKAGKLTDSAAVFRRMGELAKMPMATAAAAEVSLIGDAPSLLPPANRPAPVDLNEILNRN